MTDSQIAPWRDILWEELRSFDPQKVCTEASVSCSNDGLYSIVFMGREYYVSFSEEKVKGPEQDMLVPYPTFELVLLSYLTKAKNIPLHGRWVSEKEIPGGSTFFRGPHSLPEMPIMQRYGKDPDGFLEKGESLGGKKMEYGDVSLEFLMLPGIPLVCVLWVEDDEFPARVNYLFDASIGQQMPLDVVYAMVKCFVRKFLKS
jgi:hypothetical protein